MDIKERQCKECLFHPCIPNFAEFNFNFAANGCRKYKESDDYGKDESTSD